MNAGTQCMCKDATAQTERAAHAIAQAERVDEHATAQAERVDYANSKADSVEHTTAQTERVITGQ